MNDPKDWTIQEKNSGLIFNIAGSLWINSLSEVLKLARNMWSTISCFKQISLETLQRLSIVTCLIYLAGPIIK